VPPVKYSVQEIAPNGVGYDAYADISGDFPGSPVRLRFHFEFTPDGHIALLTIRP
jgi:hypothetical protein